MSLRVTRTHLTTAPAIQTHVEVKKRAFAVGVRTQIIAVTQVSAGTAAPTGGSAVAPASRLLTWVADRIAGVTFADGRSKSFEWVEGRLSYVDSARPGHPTIRSTLAYSSEGLIQSVTVSQLP